jgi:hypothetical protein
MEDLWMIFSSIFVFAFGIFCIIFGGFTAYFGTGRSRNIGGALILIGLIGIIIVLWFTGLLQVSTPFTWSTDVLIEAVIAVIAAILGGGAALVIFLGAIMKS